MGEEKEKEVWRMFSRFCQELFGQWQWHLLDQMKIEEEQICGEKQELIQPYWFVELYI